jgi:hypothetical protein
LGEQAKKKSSKFSEAMEISIMNAKPKLKGLWKVVFNCRALACEGKIEHNQNDTPLGNR